MGFNPHIRLNPEQMDVIEVALRSELSRLARPANDDWTSHSPDTGAIRKINELLAHLHHQKVWHRPAEAVPMG